LVEWRLNNKLKNKNMNNLVVFYSRTGNTQKIGESIGKELNCEREEIIDTKNRKGIWGFLIAGKDATLNKEAKIQEPKKDAGLYNLVIIGSPNWNGRMAPAIRTYIVKNREKFKKLALFCVYGGSGSQKVLKQMAELCQKEPLALLEVRAKEIKTGIYQEKVKKFVAGLNV